MTTGCSRSPRHRPRGPLLEQLRATCVSRGDLEGPISRMALRNSSRSSAMSIAARDGGNQLHAEFLEHALAHQIERGVERGLAAHRGQERIRALLLNDARHGAPVDRLDVDGIGGVRIGHDGGRIGVHQHHPVALFAQGLAGLGPRIIKLAGLSDDDRARADDAECFRCRFVSRHRERPVAFAERRSIR